MRPHTSRDGRGADVTSTRVDLGLTADARRALVELGEQGWLKRVRHGLYATGAPDASTERFVIEDP